MERIPPPMHRPPPNPPNTTRRVPIFGTKAYGYETIPLIPSQVGYREVCSGNMLKARRHHLGPGLGMMLFFILFDHANPIPHSYGSGRTGSGSSLDGVEDAMVSMEARGVWGRGRGAMDYRRGGHEWKRLFCFGLHPSFKLFHGLVWCDPTSTI